ncbi:hypothetical protein F0U61_15750 [Archangium violaceum]|uniref:hypothetical protein n=1 Tax=Archangium violaceum TaxID=83451 RepID=UPI002B31B952|nr:hypothetical protein F0U61_15750 [Archangium violaceum]
MKPSEQTQGIEAKVSAMEARARARMEESAAALLQAEAYEAIARACRARARALRDVSAADLSLVNSGGEWDEVERARSDGQRAREYAAIMDAEASRHESEARRATAEAKRAEAEATSVRQRARVLQTRELLDAHGQAG